MDFSKLKRINIIDLPDEVFMNGTEIVEIKRARILTRQEKKSREQGTPDIQLKDINGAESYITRNDLVKNFLGIDNKKITIGGWKSGKNYFVYSPKNDMVSVLHCPKRPKYLLILPNGRVLRPGYYCVCSRDNTGKIFKNKSMQVQPTVFKKMFVINDSADKLRDRTAQLKQIKGFNSNIKQSDIRNRAVNARDSQNQISNMGIIKNKPQSILNTPTKQIQQSIAKINDRAKLAVVGKVLNRDNQLIGYVISNGKVEKPFEKHKVIEMCRKKQLRNMTLFEKNGQEFLRCIGTTHDALPTKYM